MLSASKAILQKLTFKKFEKLTEDLLSMPFSDKDTICGLVDLIVSVAAVQQFFSELYAALCVRLAVKGFPKCTGAEVCCRWATGEPLAPPCCSAVHNECLT